MPFSGRIATPVVFASLWIASLVHADGLPEPRPLGAELPSVAQDSLDPGNPAPRAAGLRGIVTLRQALAASLRHNPRLAVYAWETRAREARILQAGLRPNPEASLEVEDLGFSGTFAGVDESQVTLRLGQLVELGGKRESRLRAAELERTLAGWDYETARLDVLTDTVRVFVEALGAQEMLTVREDAVRLATEAIGIAEARLRVGIAPEVEVTRAKVSRDEAQLEVERARLELDHSRHHLSSLWGEPHAEFERVEGSLEIALEIPDEEAIETRLAQNPELARWSSEEESRRAALALERTRAVPNVTVIGGVRRLFGPDGTTFVGEVAVPLPFWNRNQGAIAEAERRVARAGAERRAAELRVHSAFIDAFETLRGLRDQVRGLDDSILPGIRTTVDQLRRGYEEGRFSQLDVLSAERELAAARVRRVEVLTKFHQGVADLERLLSAPLVTEP